MAARTTRLGEPSDLAAVTAFLLSDGGGVVQRPGVVDRRRRPPPPMSRPGTLGAARAFPSAYREARGCQFLPGCPGMATVPARAGVGAARDPNPLPPGTTIETLGLQVQRMTPAQSVEAGEAAVGA